MRTDKRVYAPDEEIVATASNIVPAAVELSHCCQVGAFTVQEQIDDNWQIFSPYSCPPPCDPLPFFLDAGMDITEKLYIQKKGRFRINARLIERPNDGSSIVFVTSAPFDVR